VKVYSALQKARLAGLRSARARGYEIARDRRRFWDAHARLGAFYEPAGTVFRVFAPSAREVTVVIADEPEGSAGLAGHPMLHMPKGVWEAEIPGDLQGKYYAYKLSGPGFDPGREITDIYATCAQNRSTRSLIVDLTQTDPPGFRENRYRRHGAPTDAIIYEMHVRDFTIAANSGVKHRGKYLGLTERATHLPRHRAVSTGLEHLIELGVTHVQLMPVQDFDNDEKDNHTYHWGYMPVHFNSPDGWYAGRPWGADRIHELKRAIQAFHEAGIGVTLDVVYNHTAPSAGFEQLVPGYYFRMRGRGRLSNGSSCGNEFRSESPMARKFILDSLKFWVNEYQVDGFRFDMMALIDIDTMRGIRDELLACDRGLLVYGEPWAAGRTPLRKTSDTRRVRGMGIGAFNDGFRDAIKGDRDGGSPGFIQTGDRTQAIQEGLARAKTTWPSGPADTVNYFECHDNLTAFDKLLQSVPDESDELRRRMMRLASLILLTAQGTVFLHAGQEFCRTKKGSTNSYNLPDEINRIDWSLKLKYADVCAYVRGLIALRKHHPAFRLRDRVQVDQRISFPRPPTDRCLVYRLDGRRLDGESARCIRILLNGESRPITFKLPPSEWSIHADAGRAGLEKLGRVTNKATLPAHSGMMLTRACPRVPKSTDPHMGCGNRLRGPKAPGRPARGLPGCDEFSTRTYGATRQVPITTQVADCRIDNRSGY